MTIILQKRGNISSNFFNLGQEDFTPESIELVKTSILGSSFKAMVTGYHYDNTPFIQLSKRQDFVSSLE